MLVRVIDCALFSNKYVFHLEGGSACAVDHPLDCVMCVS